MAMRIIAENGVWPRRRRLARLIGESGPRIQQKTPPSGGSQRGRRFEHCLHCTLDSVHARPFVIVSAAQSFADFTADRRSVTVTTFERGSPLAFLDDLFKPLSLAGSAFPHRLSAKARLHLVFRSTVVVVPISYCERVRQRSGKADHGGSAPLVVRPRDRRRLVRRDRGGLSRVR